ncbi:MAG TPA: DUF2341 domain-containing protein [Rhizomicrobium sp.]|jgi:biopolymer transport protein ExbB
MRRILIANGRQALLFCAFLLAAFVPVTSQAEGGWWQKDWSYRKQITIDTTPKGANVTAPAGRTAVLVRLHNGNFSFGDARDNGSDLRFITSDDKTPLAFHIESFDATTGVATVWVDVPDFPAGATKDIWLYYGNKNAPEAANPAATFDPDYALVYHFDDAAQAAPHDKTAYANNAQNAPTGLDAGGVIGKAAKFGGATIMTVPASASLATTAGGQFTVSAWVRSDQARSRAVLLARHTGKDSLVFGLDNGVPFVEGSGFTRVAAPQAVPQGRWTHVAMTADGSKITIYVNGQSVASGAGTLPALNTPLSIAGDATAGSGNNNFAGELDELRISRVARSATALYVDVIGEGPDTKLIRFGVDEKQAGFGFGYFGIIVKNVTIDAWVVIGLLGIMAALSWIVMWSKATYANGIDRGNDLFLELFRRAGGDPIAVNPALAQARSRKLARSSIYRVYKSGADEIGRRTEEEHHRPVLDGAAIEVIRALMDATLIRENQKLAQNMVLLTISISGGPFLGLLGTVVGVMITFAAIAASGDVNINAIAPGISAALLATVAGLAVAIPALFGYNYLVIRNKNITANMNVFVDEFVTRLSELYRERPYARAAE